MSRDRVFTAINTVDTRFFAAQTDAMRQVPNDVESGRKVLTYVGYLSARKNVGKLLDVTRRLSTERSDFMLEIVGDGDDRANLEEYVQKNELTRFVRFVGYKQQHELPEVFARSSCFLYQTDFDIWGLVLVEAMAAGLPCVASIHAGATADLIRDGVTGFAVDFADVEASCDTIRDLLDNPESAHRIGQNARRHIAQIATIPQSAAGFVEAVTSVLRAGHRSEMARTAIEG